MICPFVHCGSCTAVQLLLVSMLHIAKKGLPIRMYNALWVKLLPSARTLLDKKHEISWELDDFVSAVSEND